MFIQISAANFPVHRMNAFRSLPTLMEQVKQTFFLSVSRQLLRLSQFK